MSPTNPSAGMTRVNDLIAMIIQGSATDEAKITLIDEIRKARPPLADRWLYRFSVWFLGAVVLITLGAGFAFVWIEDRTIPEGLLALASAAIGALATLISPSSKDES